MDFFDLQNKAQCPYNPNHFFDKEKLIFHIQRCKDKEKHQNKFRSCQYNKIYIVPKEDLEVHEIICPDRQDIINVTANLRKSLMRIEREKSRSHQKFKSQQKKEGKQEVQRSEEMQLSFFEEYAFCDDVGESLEDMKKSEITQELIGKIGLAEQLIKKYNILCKKNEG